MNDAKVYHAVIDTNVIVSSLLKTDSIPGCILKLVYSGKIIALLNEEILQEYEEVLTRNKFGLTARVIASTIQNIKEHSYIIGREQTIEEFIDADDIVFYEIVMSARNTMDAYLVTGNIKHYPVRNYVVTPRQMLEIIRKNND